MAGRTFPARAQFFRVNADGTDFTNLYIFHGSDGQNPTGGLTPSGNTLYGTTFGGGGTGKHGTIFEINTDGSGFATLFTFSGTNGSAAVAPMILFGNTLFGTTRSGGTNVAGSIFRIDTDGNNFTNLYSFTNGLDGSLPESVLAISSNFLFGTTTAGWDFQFRHDIPDQHRRQRFQRFARIHRHLRCRRAVWRTGFDQQCVVRRRRGRQFQQFQLGNDL